MQRKNNLFEQVPISRVPRNLFDLSHEVKMSGKFGYLYPCMVMDCVPGDTIRNQMTAFMRFAPMLAPVMHRIDVTTHFFFVPMRLVTDYWEAFITGGMNGTTEVVLPFTTPASIAAASVTPGDLVRKGTLWDYFGLPVLEGANPSVFSETEFSVLPFRAYQKIWNDWYRDPNFDQETDLDLAVDGEITSSGEINKYLKIQRRGWQKDYFTSALPWPQRGPTVLMPLSGVATAGDIVYSNPARATTDMLFATDVPIDYAGDGVNLNRPLEVNDRPVTIENINSIAFDNASTTINDLRRALAIQRWLENNARGGGRYIEQIQAHFNTRVPDYRLQLSEYLGGGKQPVQISEVLATAGGTDQPPVGDMGGHGISVGKSNRFTYRCQEHGFVIGIVSVMPQTAYQQCIEKMWTRDNKFDFLWPELARLGEQEIKSKEVFYSFDADDDEENEELFGYVPRYSEYKFKQDRVAGDFRDTLSIWHLSRIFVDRPVLGATFTTMYEDGNSIDFQEETYRRIFAVDDGTDYLWMQLFHRLTAKRPLPYFGVPSII